MKTACGYSLLLVQLFYNTKFVQNKKGKIDQNNVQEKHSAENVDKCPSNMWRDNHIY